MNALESAQARVRSQPSEFARSLIDSENGDALVLPDLELLRDSNGAWWAGTIVSIAEESGNQLAAETLKRLETKRMCSGANVSHRILGSLMDDGGVESVQPVLWALVAAGVSLSTGSVMSFVEACMENGRIDAVIDLNDRLAGAGNPSTAMTARVIFRMNIEAGRAEEAIGVLDLTWNVRHSPRDVAFVGCSFAVDDHLFHREVIARYIGGNDAAALEMLRTLLASYLRFGSDDAFAGMRSFVSSITPMETQEFIDDYFDTPRHSSRTIARANDIVVTHGLLPPDHLVTGLLRVASTEGTAGSVIAAARAVRSRGEGAAERPLLSAVEGKLRNWTAEDGDLPAFMSAMGEDTWGSKPWIFAAAFRLCGRERRLDWCNYLLDVAGRRGTGIARSWSFHVVDVLLAAGDAEAAEARVRALNVGDSWANEVLYGLLMEHHLRLGRTDEVDRIEKWAARDGRPVTLEGLNGCLPSFVKDFDEVGVVRVMELISNLGMEPDVVTWTNLAASRAEGRDGPDRVRRTVDEMIGRGIEPTPRTWSTLLGVYRKRKMWRQAEEVFDVAIERGLEPDGKMWQRLIASFPESSDERRRILDRMNRSMVGAESDPVLVALAVEGFLLDGRTAETRALLRSKGIRLGTGVFVDIASIIDSFLADDDPLGALEAVLLISAYGGWTPVDRLRGLLSEIPRSKVGGVVDRLLDDFHHTEFQVHSRAACVLIDTLTDRGRLGVAERVFESCIASGVEQNVFLWNSFLRTRVAAGDPAEVEAAMQRMMHSGVEPDLYSWAILTSSYVADGAPDRFPGVRSRMEAVGLRPDGVILGMFVSGYSAAGDIGSAEAVLEEAGRLGLRVDQAGWASLATSLGRERGPEAAEEIIDRLRDLGEEPDAGVWSAIVDVHAERGDPDRAEAVVARIPDFDRLGNIRRQIVLESVVRAYARAHRPVGDIDRFLPAGDWSVSSSLLAWLAVALIREGRIREAYAVLGRGAHLSTFARLIRCTAASRLNPRLFESELRALVESFELDDRELVTAYVRLMVALAPNESRGRVETLARRQIERWLEFGRTPLAVLNEIVGADPKRPWYRLMLALADRFSKASAAEFLRLIDDRSDRKAAERQFQFARTWGTGSPAGT